MNATNKYTTGIGRRMRYVRSYAGLDQFKMAEKLDLTRQSISAYETERLMPSGRILSVIADEFKVNPWWLMYGVGDLWYDPDSDLKPALGRPIEAEDLSAEQKALIRFIKSNHEAAAKISTFLWERTLVESEARVDGANSSG